MAALAADIRQQSVVRRTFTAHVKAIIEKMVSNFSWRSKGSARGDSIRMLSTMVGALILARAVDDEAFSKEILREARRGLA
jgi:TetR/AcrR family transcriptional repressor of nem operon